MQIPYGYTQNESGVITINLEQAIVVSQIYNLYLQGKSLGGIVSELKEQGIPSPTGNPAWGRAAIDKTLSNGKYVPHIIPEDQFDEVQMEKERRTNLDADNRTRRTARYNSQSVLSGLLVCGDCGRNYRRITRLSGEVVWRCADKVENGKRATCSNTATVSDEETKAIIYEQLGLAYFDEDAARDRIDSIEISVEGITVYMKTAMEFDSMTL